MAKRSLRVFGIATGPVSARNLVSVAVQRFYFVYPRYLSVRSYQSFVSSARSLARAGVEWICVEGRAEDSRRLPFQASELPDGIDVGVEVKSIHRIHGVYVVLGEGTFRACLRRTKAFGARYRLLYAIARSIGG